MYMREYKYATPKNSGSRIDVNAIGPALGDDVEDDVPVPVDPVARGGGVRKPFVPATKVNSDSRLPFGSALDGPLG
jgi:hypothetical protein